MMVGVLWCPNERRVLEVRHGDYPLATHWRQIRFEYYPDQHLWMRDSRSQCGLIDVKEEDVPKAVRLVAFLLC